MPMVFAKKCVWMSVEIIIENMNSSISTYGRFIARYNQNLSAIMDQQSEIEELAPYYFTFEYWRAGSLSTFGIETRTYSIIKNRQIIRQHAIGYLDAQKLWIRPKPNCVAVMFWFNDEHFWTHLTLNEFILCFPELEKQLKNTGN